MTQKREKTDDQILAQLRRRKTPATAAELGLRGGSGSARLRAMPDVAEVERRHTGKAGRPAAQFIIREVLGPDPTTESEVPSGQDPSSLSRTGVLNAQEV